jgi:hypothetical protein
MKITFTEDKRGEIRRIQQQFRSQLSEAQIKKGTAQAINAVMQRSISKINKGVKKGYNISAKYLSRMAAVSPKAKQNALYAGIRLRYVPVPIIGFKPKQAESAISVVIRKGKKVTVRTSFIATMNSGHTGIYARGKYKKSGFVYGKDKTSTGKTRITEIQTASPFTMGTSKFVVSEIQSFMGPEVLKRVEGILRSKVDKITNALE